MEVLQRTINRLTSKEVSLKLRHKEHDGHVSFWFKIDDRVLCIDYLPSNYPDLEIAIMSLDEARERLKEMLNEGWTIEQENEKILEERTYTVVLRENIEDTKEDYPYEIVVISNSECKGGFTVGLFKHRKVAEFIYEHLKDMSDDEIEIQN